MTGALTAISLYYSDRLLADAQSFSPSAGKPRDVVATWQSAGLAIAINDVTPATEQDLCLAHEGSYARAVLAGKRDNGFGNRSASVAASLPYTTGAMVDAARAALVHGCACAPVSGFHHAHYDSAGGFCTFNGLVVAARKLLDEGRVNRVLILDCDMHFGDGTDAIIDRLGLSDWIENATFGRWFDSPAHASRYLARLKEVAAGFDAFDLILYQAGADVHVDDPLGGVLTTAEMIERDRNVFKAARSAGIPIAWNLAGGYQEPLSRVVDLHVNTMKACINAFVARTASEPRPTAAVQHE